jgi:hypothetical protein
MAVDVAAELADIEATLSSCADSTNALVQAMTVAETEGRLAILNTVAAPAHSATLGELQDEAARVRTGAMKQLSRRMRRARQARD